MGGGVSLAPPALVPGGGSSVRARTAAAPAIAKGGKEGARKGIRGSWRWRDLEGEEKEIDEREEGSYGDK